MKCICLLIVLEQPLMSKRKTMIPIGKEETLMLLRAYKCHPGAWSEIIDDIKLNMEGLPGKVQVMYSTASTKQLRDRLGVKLRKLLASTKIDNTQIR